MKIKINYDSFYDSFGRMLRTFHPVGQGAFYSERFVIKRRRVNIVYDCGSSPSKTRVKNEIERNFGDGEKIDALFISHLDADHMNGIPFLIKRCNVENIIFPLVAKESKPLLQLQNYLKGGDNFVEIFIDNPKMAVENAVESSGKERKMPRLIGVREKGDDSNIEIESGGEADMIVHSGENISKDIGYSITSWEYVPFNFKQEERRKILEHELKKCGVSVEELIEFGRKYRDSSVEETDAKLKEIKTAYKKAVEDLNTNSMTLYSGAMIKNFKQHIFKSDEKMFFDDKSFRNGISCDGTCKKSGCLYTGDYGGPKKKEEKEEVYKELKNSYRSYCCNIGCVQVPHHGAEGSYNEELSDLDAFFVASAGENNLYKHPHCCVKKDIEDKGRKLEVVTEDPEKKFSLCVCFDK